MCNDIDQDNVLFPYDDWYDDDPYEEPEPPDCGLCYEERWIPARLFPSRRQRRCPACNWGPLRRLRRDLAWWWWRRRNRNAFTDEAPF